jgi:hypothetical protein
VSVFVGIADSCVYIVFFLSFVDIVYIGIPLHIFVGVLDSGD